MVTIEPVPVGYCWHLSCEIGTHPALTELGRHLREMVGTYGKWSALTRHFRGVPKNFLFWAGGGGRSGTNGKKSVKRDECFLSMLPKG